jgi:hypothetical protein
MFERIIARARRVLMLARKEARLSACSTGRGFLDGFLASTRLDFTLFLVFRSYAAALMVARCP